VKAGEVRAILSDAFMDGVLSQRKAEAERLEAERKEAELKARQAEERRIAEEQRIAEEKRKEAERRVSKELAETAMSDAQKRIDWAEENELGTDRPEEYASANESMLESSAAYGSSDFGYATVKAGEVRAILSDAFMDGVLSQRKAEAERLEAERKAKHEALSLIAQAQALYDWAIEKNAENNYPALINAASFELVRAKDYMQSGDYEKSSDIAHKALEILRNVEEFAPLPAQYVVRLIPERRDCLWRIAEYTFVFNDPRRWPLLFEANKKTLKDPSNPDLLYPGDVLVIPSRANEIREGTWDPKKTYRTFGQ
jgi:nucleoid-associated protein YgaU